MAHSRSVSSVSRSGCASSRALRSKVSPIQCRLADLLPRSAILLELNSFVTQMLETLRMSFSVEIQDRSCRGNLCAQRFSKRSSRTSREAF
jgi:hypothetical protein